MEQFYCILYKMHKIFLTLFILAVFFFPRSEAFAADPITCSGGQNPLCSDGTEPDLSDNLCPGAGGTRVEPTCKTPAVAPAPAAAPKEPTAVAPKPAVATTPTKTTSCDSVQERKTDTVIRIRDGADGSAVCPDDTCYTVTPGTSETFTITCYALAGTRTAEFGADCSKPGSCTSAKAVPCPGGGPGVMTAIGCVPTEPKALVEGLLKYGTLAAGGIAFIIMILAALQMITAEGNPESIKAGQEKFYSAIIGLLLIIFSVLLMQVIGVDILGLPEFGKVK